MVQRFRRLIPILVLGFAVATFGHTSVHAEDGQAQAITLTPASTDVSIDPGNSASKSVDIINGGNDPFNVTLTSSPYHVTSDSYDPQFTQLPGTIDASEWVHLSQTTATVAGKKVITVPYTINVPKNTAPGGYYAVVFAETSTDSTKTGVVSHNKVGDILYITVNGPVKSGGNLTGNAIPAIHFAGSIAIGAKISNSGGTHFITKVTYSVTDFKGTEVYKSSTERYVLPQTEREITYNWTPQSPIGIYTVHRSATIAGKLKTLPDQKIFVMSPALLIVVAFLIGLLIGIPVERARRRRRPQEK